eukprot:3938712-Rhodomonas_salina.2
MGADESGRPVRTVPAAVPALARVGGTATELGACASVRLTGSVACPAIWVFLFRVSTAAPVICPPCPEANKTP